MALRLLLGILAPGPPDKENDTQNSEIEIMPQDKDMYVMQLNEIQNAAKLHIGMLSISLVIGLAFGGFTIWWMEKKPFLNYVISLVVALVCRTFFSILFDGVIILGNGNVGGGNALLAFEQIFINLVLAFWLSLTIYIHARVQRNFKSEPTLNIYRYGVPGAAVYFAFVWIFLLQAEVPSVLWWVLQGPLTQWVVNSFNLLSILIQLVLVGDIARIMMKTSLDNDSASLFRKASILMGVLVFIFWLQFGLYMGRMPLRNSSSYTYFFYFIDGIQCGLVCLILYFFNNWVLMLINSNSRLMGEESINSRASNEELLAGGSGRGIVTLDSVFMTDESGKLKNPQEETDVVYSNVVDPQRWEKILDLYKRLNKLPNQQGTVVDGDIFYDCPFLANSQMTRRTQRSISDESGKRLSSEDRCVYENMKTEDQVQKKTAFYSSKYLVLEPKCEVPKYLETRPSLSSMSGGGSLKEDRSSKDYSPGINSLKTEERVRVWLNDNSKDTSKKDGLRHWSEEETDLDKKPTELHAAKRKPVLETALSDLGTALHTENQQQKVAEVKRPAKLQFSSKPEMPLPQKNEKFCEEIRASNAQIEEQKDYGSQQPDAKYSEAKGTYLNQYLTNSELQERRMSREKRGSDEGTQAPKNFFGFPETISSMVDYLVNKGGSLLGQRTDPKSSNTENLKAYIVPRSKDDVIIREAGVAGGKPEMNEKSQLEEQSRISAKERFPEGKIGLRTDPKLSYAENLKPYIVPRWNDVVNLRREAGVIGEKPEMNEKSISEEKRFPVSRSASSSSEFSIERNNQEDSPQELGISISEKLPKWFHNKRFFDIDTASESTAESRKSSSDSSGSFCLESYYRGLHNDKQKIEQRVESNKKKNEVTHEETLRSRKQIK